MVVGQKTITFCWNDFLISRKQSLKVLRSPMETKFRSNNCRATFSAIFRSDSNSLSEIQFYYLTWRKVDFLKKVRLYTKSCWWITIVVIHWQDFLVLRAQKKAPPALKFWSLTTTQIPESKRCDLMTDYIKNILQIKDPNLHFTDVGPRIKSVQVK